MTDKSMLEQIWGIGDDEPTICDCGATATWMHGTDGELYCDKCVPRGCQCNHRFTLKYFEERAANVTPEEVEYMAEDPSTYEYEWAWVEEGYVWEPVDGGLPFPCCDYVELECARQAVQISMNKFEEVLPTQSEKENPSVNSGEVTFTINDCSQD